MVPWLRLEKNGTWFLMICSLYRSQNQLPDLCHNLSCLLCCYLTGFLAACGSTRSLCLLHINLKYSTWVFTWFTPSLFSGLHLRSLYIRKQYCWAWACMSVIPAVSRLRQENYLSSGVWEQPGQYSKTLSKKKKIGCQYLWYIYLFVQCVYTYKIISEFLTLPLCKIPGVSSFPYPASLVSTVLNHHLT